MAAAASTPAKRRLTTSESTRKAAPPLSIHQLYLSPTGRQSFLHNDATPIIIMLHPTATSFLPMACVIVSALVSGSYFIFLFFILLRLSSLHGPPESWQAGLVVRRPRSLLFTPHSADARHMAVAPAVELPRELSVLLECCPPSSNGRMNKPNLTTRLRPIIFKSSSGRVFTEKRAADGCLRLLWPWYARFTMVMILCLTSWHYVSMILIMRFFTRTILNILSKFLTSVSPKTLSFS